MGGAKAIPINCHSWVDGFRNRLNPSYELTIGAKLSAVAPYALRTALFHNRHKCYIADMTTAEDIEKAVEQLAPRELARFRAWFEAFDAAQFDAAIERDISAGKLDAHAEEALAAHRAGRSRDL
jgi:hypothetical protein